MHDSLRTRFLQRALSVPLLGLFLHCQPGGPAAPADAGSPAPPDAAPAADAAVPAGWRIDPTVSGYAIWGTARDDVWIGSAGTFHHFDGSRWSRVPSPTTACVRGIWGSSRSDVWAVTSAACPSYSQDVSRNGAEILHWDGSSWTSVVSRSDITLTAIGGSGPADLWAVGEALGTYTGVVLHWDGTTWQTRPETVSQRPTALWASGASDVWMTTSRALGVGTLRTRSPHWDGTSWQGGTTAPRYWQFGLWASGPSDVWSVGLGGAVTHWDGTAWSPETLVGGLATKVEPYLFAVWGSGPADVWTAGNFGALAHWDGTTWTDTPPPPGGELAWWRGLWGSGPKDVWVVGEDRVGHYTMP